MSAGKHTQGEWKVCHAGSGRNGKFEIDEYYVSIDGVDMAICADVIDPRTGKMSEANARLIAAAPELLKALQAALLVIKDYLEYEHNGDPWTEDAREMGEMDIDDYRRDGRLESALAIIAKATGEAA